MNSPEMTYEIWFYPENKKPYLCPELKKNVSLSKETRKIACAEDGQALFHEGQLSLDTWTPGQPLHKYGQVILPGTRFWPGPGWGPYGPIWALMFFLKKVTFRVQTAPFDKITIEFWRSRRRLLIPALPFPILLGRINIVYAKKMFVRSVHRKLPRTMFRPP